MIISIARNFNGIPNIVFIVCDNTYAEITATGFLIQPTIVAEIAALNNGVFVFSDTDFIIIKYDTGVATFSYDPTTGSLAPASGGGVIGPTTPGHIAVFKDTVGTIGMDSDPAINNSDLSAGFNGSAGDLIAWPPQTDKGSFLILANANTGNFRTTLTNAPLGQTTTFTLPDPANTNAKIVAAAGTVPFVNGNLVFASGTNGLIEDGGATLIAGITPAWGGGGTTNTFVAPGLSSGYVGAASIVTSTNPVSIVKAVPNLAGTLIITFSADPGANTTVSYIYASAAL